MTQDFKLFVNLILKSTKSVSGTSRTHSYLFTEDIYISLVVGRRHDHVPEPHVLVVVCVVWNSASATHHEYVLYLVKRTCITNYSYFSYFLGWHRLKVPIITSRNRMRVRGPQ